MDPENNLYGLKPTDRQLPVANISGIMKNVVPPYAKISKDAKELVQKSASEFIALVSCMAKDLCESENRKTVTGDDLVRAMKELGFGPYSDIASRFFVWYKGGEKDKFN